MTIFGPQGYKGTKGDPVSLAFQAVPSLLGISAGKQHLDPAGSFQERWNHSNPPIPGFPFRVSRDYQVLMETKARRERTDP